MDLQEQNIKYFSIAKTSDLQDGERLFFEILGHPIVLFFVDGSYLATGDLCSHDEGPIGDGILDGEVIICPRHGARFDIHTGKALSMPAVTEIPVYPVRISQDKIEVGIIQ
jgi:3-phenylpropionate/trans-cinnamate dioxygenase ferredoxin subunit